MKKFIKISGIHDIAEFVTYASEVNGDVCVQRGRFIIDGKSLMGMLSIDTSEGVIVEYPEDAAFSEYLKKFE